MIEASFLCETLLSSVTRLCHQQQQQTCCCSTPVLLLVQLWWTQDCCCCCCYHLTSQHQRCSILAQLSRHPTLMMMMLAPGPGWYKISSWVLFSIGYSSTKLYKSKDSFSSCKLNAKISKYHCHLRFETPCANILLSKLSNRHSIIYGVLQLYGGFKAINNQYELRIKYCSQFSSLRIFQKYECGDQVSGECNGLENEWNFKENAALLS